MKYSSRQKQTRMILGVTIDTVPEKYNHKMDGWNKWASLVLKKISDAGEHENSTCWKIIISLVNSVYTRKLN